MSVYPRAKIDSCSIERANGHGKSVVAYTLERACLYNNDPYRAERLALAECPVCYRGGRQGGTVCTSRQCGLCNAEIHSGNTNIDVLCLECAKANDLCKHCGADIDLKNRRKKRRFQE